MNWMWWFEENPNDGRDVFTTGESIRLIITAVMMGIVIGFALGQCSLR